MTGQQIRDARQRLRMTQQQFADALGVSATAVAMWERGERTPHTPKVLELAIMQLTPRQ